jgi:hypothetical protein
VTRTISIDRAPVLTLWAAVVAERLGNGFRGMFEILEVKDGSR